MEPKFDSKINTQTWSQSCWGWVGWGSGYGPRNRDRQVVHRFKVVGTPKQFLETPRCGQLFGLSSEKNHGCKDVSESHVAHFHFPDTLLEGGSPCRALEKAFWARPPFSRAVIGPSSIDVREVCATKMPVEFGATASEPPSKPRSASEPSRGGKGKQLESDTEERARAQRRFGAKATAVRTWFLGRTLLASVGRGPRQISLSSFANRCCFSTLASSLLRSTTRFSNRLARSTPVVSAARAM